MIPLLDKELLQLNTDEQSDLAEVLVELRRAKALHKWPMDPIHQAGVVSEESGEVMKAALEYYYEDGLKSCIKKEAVQTAATALRLIFNHKP